MHNLQHFQIEMTAAVLSGNMTGIADEFTAANADPGRRLGIYHSNTMISLTAALRATFPVTAQLADDRFFAYAAHAFIVAEPPRQALLSAYGAKFPGFLASFLPCRGYPIIAQMAALEWAIACSLNNASEPSAAISQFDSVPNGGEGASLRLQPNLHFAISRWNLVNVWIDHRKEGGPSLRPLEVRISRIAIIRQDEDIQLIALDRARFAFWRSLMKGLSVEQAMCRALAKDPLFDMVLETVLLFRAGLVTNVISSTVTR